MKFIALLILCVSLFTFSACSTKKEAESASHSQKDFRLQTPPEARQAPADLPTQPIALKDADAANMASQAFARKIIRNADLTIEVTSASDSQNKLVTIAESHQGFVVTSEATLRNPEDKSRPETTVNLVVRVPAAQFNQVMEEIRGVAVRIIQQKITGQDVTEEFIDLEARIKNQKALELQFLEIMKRAGKVEDALSVQRELADVRTEIEKLEGRRRFLENQSSLSTINVTLQPPTQIVNATGFWYSVRTAFSDGVDVAAEIILFLIRAIIAMAPVMVLIVLPLALLAKLGVRIARRRRASLATAGAVSE